MKKIIIHISLIFVLFTLRINAGDNRFINEINSITLDKTKRNLVVEGWGFLQDAQNYHNTSTHNYVLELKGKKHTFTVNGTQKSISQTETMRYVGSRFCKNNEFFKDSLVCNNYYDNIGFSFKIPLSMMRMEEDYKVKLIMTAKQAKLTKSTEVYFPNKNAIEYINKHDHYIIDSKLHNIGVKILDDHIMVRDKPNKQGKVLTGSGNCSSDKRLYYKKGSIYKNIYDKKTYNNTTYYKLKGKISGCHLNKIVIQEGNKFDPIWIASTFVDHVGETLTIKTRKINKAPELSVGPDIVIQEGDSIDLWKGVSAYDYEDGDLTKNIKIVKNNFKNKVGVYKITYSVTDSFKATTNKTRLITVLRRNYPPQISANDITLKQYSSYDPYDYAKAYDQDKKDISSLLQSTSDVDTSILGVQKQCYKVKDSFNLTSQKCISVTIEQRAKSFRFIQYKNLFYKEPIPHEWKSFLPQLKDELSNEIVYDEKEIKF